MTDRLKVSLIDTVVYIVAYCKLDKLLDYLGQWYIKSFLEQSNHRPLLIKAISYIKKQRYGCRCTLECAGVHKLTEWLLEGHWLLRLYFNEPQKPTPWRSLKHSMFRANSHWYCKSINRTPLSTILFYTWPLMRKRARYMEIVEAWRANTTVVAFNSLRRYPIDKTSSYEQYIKK